MTKCKKEHGQRKQVHLHGVANGMQVPGAEEDLTCSNKYLIEYLRQRDHKNSEPWDAERERSRQQSTDCLQLSRGIKQNLYFLCPIS